MTPTVIALLGVIFGGGGIVAFVNFRKAGSESSVMATQSLIAVNEELRRDLKRRDEQNDTLQRELEGREGQNKELRQELELRRTELNELRERVAVLEDKSTEG